MLLTTKPKLFTAKARIVHSKSTATKSKRPDCSQQSIVILSKSKAIQNPNNVIIHRQTRSLTAKAVLFTPKTLLCTATDDATRSKTKAPHSQSKGLGSHGLLFAVPGVLPLLVLRVGMDNLIYRVPPKPKTYSSFAGAHHSEETGTGNEILSSLNKSYLYRTLKQEGKDPWGLSVCGANIGSKST